MLFCVTGASGAGKSACRPGLQACFPALAWYDFDAGIPHIPPGITTGRQWLTEYWLQRTLEHQARGQDIGLRGQMVYGEILAALSAPLLAGLAVCLLDCADVVRMDRLRALHLPPGGINIVSQQMLNWASWLRMHAVDPQWEPDVIRHTGPLGWRWERWATWQRGDPRWQVWTLDTTDLTAPDVVTAVAAWVGGSGCSSRVTQLRLRDHN